ncbi:MAG: hypothetical protein JSW46_07675 [Gemmatimonadota bacterium]|nr:MAG: hypothetical protein JSW46_07675 [Gemmatimonadota bacterium]
MRVRIFPVRLAIAALILVACERDELVDVDPEVAPGPSSPTLETLLGTNVLSDWADTTFGGFTRAGVTGYIQVVGGAPVGTTRGLLQYDVIEVTVRIPGIVSAVETYDSARVVMEVDSAQTFLPAAGMMILQLVEVQQEWDVSATWEFAVDTLGVAVPWSGGPGGSLGPTILAEDTLELIVTDTTTEMPDSLVFWLGEASDSLLKLWVDSLEVNTGLAVVVADSGHTRLTGARLNYNMIPVDRPDTAVVASSASTAGTFIYDPTGTENIEGILRVGGIEGWRTYTQFVIPDSVPVLGSTDTYPLRGSTINKAELLLVSVDQRSPPFQAEDPFQTLTYELADDFLVFGPKTPVGNRVGAGDVLVVPDSIAVGDTVRFELTRLLAVWSGVSQDSVPLLRFVVRPASAAATFGFWEFGAIDGDPGFTPSLRIVFTPPVGFSLP